MNPLTNKKILLAVTGGIAVYKALDLARRLMERGASVQALMTESAQKFVTPLSFQTLTGNPVLTDLFSLEEEERIGHIQAAQAADLIVMAPATANSIAKASLGLADDYLGTLLLATRAPLVICPAMNPAMYSHHKTQEHIQALLKAGATLVPPGVGEVACGDYGQGRLAEIPEILLAVENRLKQDWDHPLEGVTALITAGPTRERIDAVRYISNDSSGKMGYALATEMLRQGAKVILVSGPVSLSAPSGAEMVRVESAREMYEAVMARRKEAGVIVGCAAVADVAVKSPSAEKIKKDQLKSLDFEENPDILRAVGQSKEEGQVIVGFAAETRELEANARAKLERKNLDLIVANDVCQPGGVFGKEENQAILIGRDFTRNLDRLPKPLLAQAIIEEVVKLLP